MIKPKIVYGTGPTTLNFTWPPMGKPGTFDREIQRNDVVTLSGLQQSMYWRTDKFFNVQMDIVPQADIANWDAFFDFAETGAQFEFYPDATVSGTHFPCTWADLKFSPARAFIGVAKFTLRFRKA